MKWEIYPGGNGTFINFKLSAVKNSQNIADIEKRIWSYLDQDCSAAESSEIALLIKTDSSWKEKFVEISEFQESLSVNSELHQPSMRFSKNILEIVEKENIVHPVKTYMNQWVIRAIMALFSISISVIIISLFSANNSSTGNNSLISNVVNFAETSGPSTQVIYYAFLLLNVIAALALLDSLLKRKINEKVAT
jgi:hypothetical protein